MRSTASSGQVAPSVRPILRIATAALWELPINQCSSNLIVGLSPNLWNLLIRVVLVVRRFPWFIDFQTLSPGRQGFNQLNRFVNWLCLSNLVPETSQRASWSFKLNAVSLIVGVTPTDSNASSMICLTLSACSG
jgi:hypothetical protein